MAAAFRASQAGSCWAGSWGSDAMAGAMACAVISVSLSSAGWAGTVGGNRGALLSPKRSEMAG
ncbi:hypothetical protein GCM10012320_03080 [Sinomonas cellulolyticus]|nr:hypothetical protein GCM10012320_03080 [Sinomonas sp. KCTC 49339]